RIAAHLADLRHGCDRRRRPPRRTDADRSGPRGDGGREKRRQLARAGAEAVALDLFAPEQVRSEIAGYDVVVNLATHIPRGMRVFLAGVWRENGRLRRIASAILSEAARAGGA